MSLLRERLPWFAFATIIFYWVMITYHMISIQKETNLPKEAGRSASINTQIHQNTR